MMASLLMLIVVYALVAVGVAAVAGVVVALWMARRTGGGAFYIWRFCLIYDAQGDEPFPGKGYTMNLDDGVEETIRVLGNMEEEAMLDTEIEKRFSYHPPHSDQPLRYETIRAKAKEMAYVLSECCPGSPDLTKALNHLDLTVFLANASIARNEVNPNNVQPMRTLGGEKPRLYDDSKGE